MRAQPQQQKHAHIRWQIKPPSRSRRFIADKTNERTQTSKQITARVCGPYFMKTGTCREDPQAFRACVCPSHCAVRAYAYMVVWHPVLETQDTPPVVGLVRSSPAVSCTRLMIVARHRPPRDNDASLHLRLSHSREASWYDNTSRMTIFARVLC